MTDLIESVWFEDRNDVFCDESIPKNCAYPDPLRKDLYVEIDWMIDPLTNRSFKPGNSQITSIKDVFAYQGINFYADTGEFGGGNALPVYEESLALDTAPSQIDFSDLKYGSIPYSANFESNRSLIWRYMISGYKYAENPASSGRAEVSGDDIFISYGLIEDTFIYTNLDTAISGTMIHEIGHTLCLSSVQLYIEQPLGCVFDGIDSNVSMYNSYISSMNYSHQLELADYSDGTSVSFDNDDWSAVLSGIRFLSETKTALGRPYSSNSSTNDKIAFDLEMSPDSGMTAEDSRKIYEQRKNHPELYPTRSPKAEVSQSPAPIHPDKLSADYREKREQESKFASIAIPIVSIMILIGFASLSVYLTRKQSRTKPNKKRRKR